MPDIAGFGNCENIGKEECFAFINGRCRILHTCDFKNGKCPFRQTKEEKERKEWEIKHR